jgi:hypothetical protein
MELQMAQHSKNPNQQHLDNPRDNPYTDHHIEIVRRKGIHPYEMLCRECGCHVKWAREQEYIWVNYFKPTATFRQLFWAPNYNADWQTLADLICKERFDADKVTHQVTKSKKWITGKELGI